MDKDFLTHQINVGLGHAHQYRPDANMRTPGGREALTTMLVEHLVNNWNCIQGLQAAQEHMAEPSKEDKIWQAILNREERARMLEAEEIGTEELEAASEIYDSLLGSKEEYEAYGLKYPDDEPVATLDLGDADLGTTCGECLDINGWHFVECSRPIS